MCCLLRAVLAKPCALRLLAIVLCGLVLTLSQPVLAQTILYTVTDLGTLGGASSQANGINDSGQVVGYAYTPSGSTHAFLYSGGIMTDLGTLPGGTQSVAYGINASGQVVGYSSIDSSGDDHAFLYSGGVMKDLGTLGGSGSAAYGINASGQVIGNANTASHANHAFLYSGGIMTDLGTLGGSFSIAQGINASGQVVGQAANGSGDYDPFLYSGGVMSDLGGLSSVLGGVANGINDLGQVVGYGYAAISDEHAFLYSGGVITDLGALPGGSSSQANGINASGQVVGEANTATSSDTFVWDNIQGMRDLNSLIDPNSGWMLQAVGGINDQGQIAGYGLTNGQFHAFLLTPIDHISPNHGGNAGFVTMTIVRPSLPQDATVQLVTANQTHITGANTVWTNSQDFQTTVLQTTFDLRNSSPGPCSVVVTNSNQTITFRLASTFTIEQSGVPNVQVNLDGSDLIIGGLPATFTLQVTNQGNDDALDVPLWIAGLPSSPTPILDFSVNTLANTGDDSAFVTTSTQDILPLVLSRLPAGATRTFQFQFTPPSAGAGSYTQSLRAWVAPAYQQVSRDSLSFDLTTGLQSLLQAVYLQTTGTLPSSASLAAGVTSLQAQLVALQDQAYGNTSLLDTLTPLTQLVAQAVTAIAKQQSQTLNNTKLDSAINAVLSQLDSWPPTAALFSSQTNTTRTATVGDAYDPNNIRGPLSLKGGPWISGAQSLAYTIAFDNVGMAAAGEVQVQQYLDANLDPMTVSLGQINLPAQQLVQPTPGISPIANVRPYFQQQALPGENLNVNTNSALSLSVSNPNTSQNIQQNIAQLNWDFQSIDPSTGQPPTNTALGFLLPGAEGSMTITVTPRINLPTGTPISVSALINFGYSTSNGFYATSSLPTSTWTNFIDNTPPTSQVQVPAKSGLIVLVKWTASDAESGLQDVTIYVSDNSTQASAFHPWLVNTTATQATFIGAVGHTYRFYSVGRDNVGNVEGLPADTTTSSRVVTTRVVQSVLPVVPKPVQPSSPPILHPIPLH
jgi:probable HAF family extracellular repeat protein